MPHFLSNISFLFLIFLPTIINCKVISETFKVEYKEGAPDGVSKAKVLTINGKFPGPTITGKVGDTLRIKVINNIQDGQNTTIHWHGLYQQGTPFEDGPSGITQCPIKNGDTYTYEFPLTQSGTYWYHSHQATQYADGLWGALIIKAKKEKYVYDKDIVITLNDWYHLNAQVMQDWLLSTRGSGDTPYLDSALLNGKGRANCTIASRRGFKCKKEQQYRHIFNVAPGKRYRFRVINTGGHAAFRFSIDNHKLTTIEVDGIDTVAVPTDMAVIATGQRYSFLVDTRKDLPTSTTGGNRFLIRADIITQDLGLRFPNNNITPNPTSLITNLTAVLNYVPEQSLQKSCAELPKREQFSYDANIPLRSLAVSSANILDQQQLTPLDGVLAPAKVNQQLVLNITFVADSQGIGRGSFNGLIYNYTGGEPLLARMLNGQQIPAETNPFFLGFNNVIEVVVNNAIGKHPIHLHGHSFWVVGAGKDGDGVYNPQEDKLILNGVKRDTIYLQRNSWAVLRFVADNPGVWTFHCHIDWHNVMGMIATFYEAQREARQALKITDKAKKVCAKHGILI